MTTHEAMQHAWINPPYGAENPDTIGSGEDLLPTLKKNFNARRALHKAIDTVRAINKLREGGGLMMDGAMSVDPRPERVNGDDVVEEKPGDGGYGQAQMEIDSRGNARGQTEEQIREQERRVKETVTGLWSRSVRK